MKQYQELLLPGRVVPGERECGERWELIRPVVPDQGMILDVGSNLGYYALRAAQTSPGVAVVSVEADGEVARTQRRVMAAHQMHRVCVLRGHLQADVTAQWRETCDWFDLILLLSVVHWFDEPETVVAHLAEMTGRLVVELPDHRDSGACGQEKIRRWEDPVGWVAKITGRSCRLLGRPSRHTSGYPSHLVLVEGPVERTPLRAYWGSEHRHPEGNAYRIDFDGESMTLWIRGSRVDYVPGANVSNLMQLGGLEWPQAGWWMRNGLGALARARGHLDPLPHNMLWTPEGLRLIDGADVSAEIGRMGAAMAFGRSLRRWSRGETVDPGAQVPSPQIWRRVIRDPVVFGARRFLPWPVYRRIRSLGRRILARADRRSG